MLLYCSESSSCEKLAGILPALIIRTVVEPDSGQALILHNAVENIIKALDDDKRVKSTTEYFQLVFSSDGSFLMEKLSADEWKLVSLFAGLKYFSPIVAKTNDLGNMVFSQIMSSINSASNRNEDMGDRWLFELLPHLQILCAVPEATVAVSNFLAMLLRILVVEMTLITEELFCLVTTEAVSSLTILALSDGSMLSEEKDKARIQERERRSLSSWMLLCCYLHCYVDILCQHGERMTLFGSEQLLDIQQQLLKLLHDVIQLIHDCIEHLESPSSQTRVTQRDLRILISPLLLVTCQWANEDDTVRTHLLKLLPVLWKASFIHGIEKESTVAGAENLAKKALDDFSRFQFPSDIDSEAAILFRRLWLTHNSWDSISRSSWIRRLGAESLCTASSIQKLRRPLLDMELLRCWRAVDPWFLCSPWFLSQLSTINMHASVSDATAELMEAVIRSHSSFFPAVLLAMQAGLSTPLPSCAVEAWRVTTMIAKLHVEYYTPMVMLLAKGEGLKEALKSVFQEPITRSWTTYEALRAWASAIVSSERNLVKIGIDLQVPLLRIRKLLLVDMALQ